MKQIIIMVLSLALAYQQLCAQDSTRLISFREKLLPQNTLYFSGADLTEKGLLELAAVDRYIGLPANDKKTIMTNIAAAWREPLVLVRYGSKTELWGWNGETGNTELLDNWNHNLSNLAKMPDMPPRLPWFFYVGDQFAISSGVINFSFNTRVGSFLLDNKWDCAATFSLGFMGYSGSDNTTNSWSLGIMGRRHFLIQNSTFSPNIGAQLMHSSSEGYSTNTLSLVVGISWFVGIGSIDFDLTIGSEVTGMGGYTIAPNMAKR